MKNGTELVLVKDKVSQNTLQISQNEQQISTNYTKQEELRKLLDERLNSTSLGLLDISTPRQGLTIKSVLVGHTKYTTTIQLGN